MFNKLPFNQIESYNKQSSFSLGVKQFCTILNNQPVIGTIKNLNGSKTSNTCFDFSTLHINIPHGKLIRVLKEHIYFCGDGKFILDDRYGAQWSNRQKAGSISFTKSSLKRL